MSDNLMLLTAKMLREHFHASGMTKEVAELDEAIAAEEDTSDTAETDHADE